MNELVEQVKSIIDKEVPLISNLSNVSAVLNQIENINWVGFYLVDNDRLVLGPFQGEVACTIIPFGKGVCGYSYSNKKTAIVDDVDTFKGHIRCSSKSKSEIVVPIIKDDKVVALIDIDSPILNRFNQDDANYLEKISIFLSALF